MFPLIAVACSLTAAPFDPIPQDKPLPPPTEPKRDPENVAELYNAYRYYGLPLPAKGSYLAKRERTVTHILHPGNRKETVNEFHLVLIRNEQDKLRNRDFQKVDPLVNLLEKNRNSIVPGNMSVNHWMYSSECLIFAAQAHHLGWTDAAKYGWDEGSKSSDLEESKTPILNFLKTSSWQYHRVHLLEPQSNRRIILDRMTRCLCSHDPEFHEIQREFHGDLKRSIRLDWCRRGSPDEIVNGIVRGEKTFDDLLLLGFDAVPTIIRHLDDTRFTRETAVGGINNSLHLYNVRVNERCSDLLDSLFEDVSRYRKINPDDNGGVVAYRVQADEAREWFRTISHLGEQRWCVDNLLRTYDHLHPDTADVNESILVILRERHPSELASLVARQVKRVVPGHSLLSAMATSRLPKERKLATLRKASTNANVWHPIDVVRAWSLVDRKEGRDRFATMLNLAVTTGDLKSIITRVPDLTILDALHEFGDSELWNRFETNLDKIDIETRFTMIYSYFSARDQRPHVNDKKRQIACLLKSTADRSVVPDQFAKEYNDLGVTPLSLGHVAVIKLARLLVQEIPSNKTYSPAEWAELRDKVRQAAEKELAKN